jgi:hypothetical protein
VRSLHDSLPGMMTRGNNPISVRWSSLPHVPNRYLAASSRSLQRGEPGVDGRVHSMPVPSVSCFLRASSRRSRRLNRWSPAALERERRSRLPSVAVVARNRVASDEGPGPAWHRLDRANQAASATAIAVVVSGSVTWQPAPRIPSIWLREAEPVSALPQRSPCGGSKGAGRDQPPAMLWSTHAPTMWQLPPRRQARTARGTGRTTTATGWTHQIGASRRAVAQLPSRFGRLRIVGFWNNREGASHRQGARRQRRRRCPPGCTRRPDGDVMGSGSGATAATSPRSR